MVCFVPVNIRQVSLSPAPVYNNSSTCKGKGPSKCAKYRCNAIPGCYPEYIELSKYQGVSLKFYFPCNVWALYRNYKCEYLQEKSPFNCSSGSKTPAGATNCLILHWCDSTYPIPNLNEFDGSHLCQRRINSAGCKQGQIHILFKDKFKGDSINTTNHTASSPVCRGHEQSHTSQGWKFYLHDRPCSSTDPSLEPPRCPACQLGDW